MYKIVVVGIDKWDEFTHPFIAGLRQHNPRQVVTLVDNASVTPYQHMAGVDIVRLEERVGYASAINAGAGGDWDWMIVCNNDCVCWGDVTDAVIPHLDDGTLYGAGWNEWYAGMVESGYLYIPRRIWDTVGPFDPAMDAAFEDFDYMLRVMAEGFRVEVAAKVPMRHLYAHTRYDESGYQGRWNRTRAVFDAKWPQGMKRTA